MNRNWFSAANPDGCEPADEEALGEEEDKDHGDHAERRGSELVLPRRGKVEGHELCDSERQGVQLLSATDEDQGLQIGVPTPQERQDPIRRQGRAGQG